MAVNPITTLNLGSVLQILFSKGLTTQISRDYADYDNVLFSMKKDNAIERQYNYYLIKSLGPSAIKWQNVGTTGRSFPTGSQVTSQEITAYMKEIQATIELEQNLWERAKMSPLKYAEPLEVEVQAKLEACKREMAKMLHGDGTGVLGAVSSITNSGALAAVTLKTGDTDPGFVAWFEPGDEVEFYAADGTTEHQPGVASGTPTYCVVSSIDRPNNVVYLTVKDASAVTLTCNGAGTVVNTDFLYRKNQNSRPNRSSVSDYGTETDVMVGLESLTATDGRAVFGMTMSGVTGGTRVSCGGNAIDTAYIEQVMNNLKIAAGPSIYNWDQMLMAYETQTALINSKEADRRFTTVEDNTRGSRFFAYQHRGSTLKCVDSEFAPGKRIWLLPKPKSGEFGETGYAIEFRGTPFEHVKVQGQDQFLKPSSSGGYVGMVQSFLNAYGTLIVKHPKACGVLHNFTV
jgi:hypothetical protein